MLFYFFAFDFVQIKHYTQTHTQKIKTGDGKVDGDDAQVFWNRAKETLTDKVPGAGGFSAGFLLGARRG